MSRLMRLLLFFDLPSITKADMKRYRIFHKDLINDGYIMLQESVYCKIVTNLKSAELAKERIAKKAPSEGLIQVLIITEKQFNKIEFISGELPNKIGLSADRMIIL